MLLDLGVDVNLHNSEGRTALMGAAHKGRNEIVQMLVDHGAELDAHDIGSRDTIHKLAGVNWHAIDYADGLVRVGVQSAIPHPETSALLRKLMMERGLKVAAGRAHARVDLHHRHLPARGLGERARRRGRQRSMISR